MMRTLLVANRGEIAVRVMRAAAELGVATVAVHSEDDADCLHVSRADVAVPLSGAGPAAYLDVDQLLGAAKETGCDAVHPGYGFLAENAGFARRCAEVGLVFVGPDPSTLDTFGDKTAGRHLARQHGVPVLQGTDGPTSIEEAAGFLAALGPSGAMVKAVSGGGGRGMRAARSAAELEAAWERCRSEAAAAFGDGSLYVEELLVPARHIEVQAAGDGSGAVTHLWERDCSVQRRFQKLIEVAPAAGLDPRVRDRLIEAALRLAEAVDLSGLATFEFLVAPDGRIAFIEANPRLQVEHTVTEEVTGVDLVVAQLRLASGLSLAEAGLDEVPEPRGFAVQARVNLEAAAADGSWLPAGGTVTRFEPPTGPGVRVDTHGYSGYAPSPRFDSLLAKVIGHHPSARLAPAAARTARALAEMRVEGAPTNAGLLRAVLEHDAFVTGAVDIGFLEAHAAELSAAALGPPPTPGPGPTVGARVDPRDPLAVLHHGKSGARASAAHASPTGASGVAAITGPPGTEPVTSPMQGTVVTVEVSEGETVGAGQQLLVLEAMKMEHVIAAPVSGVVRQLTVKSGDVVAAGHPLAFLEPAEVEADFNTAEDDVDLDHVRPDLAEVHQRHQIGLDAARPEAVARRRRTGQRTARQNIEDLCDPGSFAEYGPVVIAAQRRRRPVEELIERTPADGLVAGIGTVNAETFGPEASRCVVMSYDYTVLAGTQGLQNHRKKDRMFELAAELRLPVVFFTEGGGGRPGDTDGTGVAGLDCMAFNLFGRLSGLVPLVGINSGRCFAGNAALLGCCDVVIACADSNIGMGGPAMIEGGGLGVFRPDEVGPMEVQVPNGVVDVAVADEAEAVEVARRYLSYFQGRVAAWDCADQRLLRRAIPENRLRVYDVRRVIELLADTGSVLELRRHFGPGMVTSLVRVGGRPLGVIANNPTHLAGAIDATAADKAARFMQLCDAFDVPLLFLCDTPGIMVGPEVEKTALVRHAARMFVTGASLTVPFFTIILRKGYGLGAQAMAGGSFKAPLFTVAWPTGEFGGMGLEGAVKLGYRNELAAVEDPDERREVFDEMVARMYEHGKALNTASHFEIDDVIDPIDSRRWILTALESAPPPPARAGKKRPNVDTW
ncbi:MAG TPA: carboxyl transferase domain-containing protein [Acidimicrobiales bacterium]|nr:carboxyl transferase domain-containing protein [Acidimicrobiales bacterium]